MRVLTVDASGGLLIPSDKDIPVKITTELAALLTDVRAQFPSDSASPGVDGEGHKSDDQKFNDISALRAKFDTVKCVSRTSCNIWIVYPKGEGKSFSADAGTRALRVENASDKQALTIPAGTDLCGCGNAVSNTVCFFVSVADELFAHYLGDWICFHAQRQAFSWSPPIPSMPIRLAVFCGASNALAPKRRMFQRRMLWFAMVQT